MYKDRIPLKAASAVLALATLCASQLVASREAPLAELYRIDCGSIEGANLHEFSDTYLYEGKAKRCS